MSVRIAGGRLRGRQLRSPRVKGLRPTSEMVRAAVFSILGRDAIEGARVLDLYAGTGALGIEALSRDALWVDFVESNGSLTRRMVENLHGLGLEERGRVYHGRVESMLHTLPGDYDLVFSDPPYDLLDLDSLMSGLSERPLVKEGGIAVVEHRHTTVLAQSYGKLEQTSTRRYGDSAVTFFQSGELSG